MQEVTLLVTYTTKPGCAQAFVNDVAATGVLEAIRAEEGCRGYSYYLPADGSDAVLLVERWASRALQQAHLQQPHMETIAAIKAAYVEATEVSLLASACES